MLKWLTQKANRKIFIGDLKSSISALEKGRPDVRKEVAEELWQKVATLGSISAAAPHMSDMIIKGTLEKASRERDAVAPEANRLAKSGQIDSPYGHVPWAKASILEAWCHGLLGTLGEDGFEELQTHVMSFVRSNLQQPEIDKILEDVQEKLKAGSARDLV